MIDPNFKFPEVLRGNVGYDHSCPAGSNGSPDFVCSKTIEDIKYQNLNFVQVPARPASAAGSCSRARSRRLSDAILLENTNKGYTYNLAYEIPRPFTNGLFLQGSYPTAWPSASWTGPPTGHLDWGFVYVPGNPNDAPLTRSNFDPGHRFTLTTTYDIPFPKSVNRRCRSSTPASPAVPIPTSTQPAT